LSVWVAKSYSSGDRDLKQTATVLPPPVAIKRGGSRGWCAGALRRRHAIERAVDAMGVVIVPEFAQFSRQNRELSRATILKLADSLLPEKEPLRRTFLAAPTISRVLAGD